jgi:3-phosphoshikimate 1-carboxyvinyltransferase
LAADQPVKVDDTAFIATSFPDFVPMMRSLGAEFV